MRILLLAPYFFPYVTPRAYRWTAIAREWAKRGWEVHVVCAQHRDRPAQREWEGVHVHPAGLNSAKELAYFYFPKIPRRGTRAVRADEAKSTQFPRVVNECLLKSWYWPDDAWMWMFAARRKAQHLLLEGKWDAVISVSLPFSTHWVAKKVKSRFPKLFWLADMGDPFALQTDHPLNNRILYQQKNKRAEEAVLRSADQIVVTNEGLNQAYRNAFPSLKTPIQVIPPLSSPQSLESANPATDSPLQLGYFGSFFRNIREPEPLLRFLEKNFGAKKRWHLYPERWHLHFYGAIFEEFWPVFDRFPALRPHLTFHGLLPRENVVSEMQKMDVLVMLGNTTSFQLPSKWADYLVAGRPVLHLVQNPRDPALPIVKNESHVLSLPSGDANEELPTFLERSKEWIASESILKKWRSRFSAPVIASAYADLLSPP